MDAPASTSRQETAGQIETSNDSLIPPGSVTHQHVLLDAEAEIERLQGFLEINFPADVGLSNRQLPESPVEVAMRLLMGMQARTGIQAATRCSAEYCNQNMDHRTPHGWVHYE